MTTPQPFPKYPSDPLESMKNYIGKALENREEFYKGVDEAENDWRTRRKGTAAAQASSAEAARQIFRSSAIGKTLIADNRWHMVQAMMFGVASCAQSLYTIARDIHLLRKMAEQELGNPYKGGIPSQRRK